MPNEAQTKVLVVFSTWTGATRQVAEAVARRLEADGAAVTLAESAKVESVTQFDAVVIGCSVHAGKTTRHSLKFAKRFAAELARVPVAWFQLSLTMSTDQVDKREQAMAYLEPLQQAAPQVTPVAIGLFAGTILRDTEEYRTLFFPLRSIAKSVASKDPVDHRDWEAIDAWASELMPLFAPDRVAVPA